MKNEKENPTLGDENPILAWMRAKLIANQAPIAADQNQMKQAAAIDAPAVSSAPVANMADGGDISSAFSSLMTPFKAFAAPAQAVGHAAAEALPSVNPIENLAMNMAVNRMNAQIQPQQNQAQVTQMQTQTQAPAMPDLSMAAQNAQNMPSTPVDPNQGISAEDRANLYKQLLARKSSPGMLAASGAAGLGDAISRSFGHQNTDYQKNLGEQTDKNTEAQIGAVDTERQQKLSDIQAKSEAALNDPNSSLSQSMRKTLIASGVQVPSGMSGALMLKVAGPLAEMAKAKATTAEAHFGHEITAATKEEALKESREKLTAEHPIQNLLGMLPGSSSNHPSGAKITRIN